MNNIIVGKVNVDHHGKIEINNITNKDVGLIILKKKGWFNKEAHYVSGNIMNSFGDVKYTVEGHWSSEMNIKNEETGEVNNGYTVNPHLPEYELSYYFTEFALQLNLPPELFPGIAPTDSRFRPDQRALENANIEVAGTEKVRLEEKQRKTRKIREEKGEEYKPMWFYLNDGEWVYKGGYWQAKQYSQFNDCPDIY